MNRWHRFLIPLLILLAGPAGFGRTGVAEVDAEVPHAWRAADHRPVVEPDPAAVDELVDAPPDLREEASARAYVHRGRESYAETSDADRLPALMTRIERGA